MNKIYFPKDILGRSELVPRRKFVYIKRGVIEYMYMGGEHWGLISAPHGVEPPDIILGKCLEIGVYIDDDIIYKVTEEVHLPSDSDVIVQYED